MKKTSERNRRGTKKRKGKDKNIKNMLSMEMILFNEEVKDKLSHRIKEDNKVAIEGLMNFLKQLICFHDKEREGN